MSRHKMTEIGLALKMEQDTAEMENYSDLQMICSPETAEFGSFLKHQSLKVVEYNSFSCNAVGFNSRTETRA